MFRVYCETGNVRFRKDWRGRLVLEMEVSRYRDDALGGSTLTWRDCTEGDLSRVRKTRRQKSLEPLI